MSVVTYNDIKLAYPLHNSFSQESVYDDQGQTDWVYQRYDISVMNVINTKLVSTIIPDTILDAEAAAELTPVQIMRFIRGRLLQPRKTLSIKIGENDLIPAKMNGVTHSVDAKNGPLPQSCIISQLQDTTFLMTWRIIAHYYENLTQATEEPPVNKAGNATINNRWTETVDIDSRDYTTRTRIGKYIIRSDNIDGAIADDVRSQMAVVGVPNGFVRSASSYTVSPDGLAIQYRITDREVRSYPPRGAFEATGTYIESTTKLGAMRWGEVRTTLRGSKNSALGELVGTAIISAASKLKVSGAAINGVGAFTQLDHSSISVNMYDNEVTVAMRALMGPNQRVRQAGIATVDLNQIVQLDNVPKEQPPYQDRGTAGLLLQAAAYYDPRLQQRLERSLGQLNPGQMPGRGDLGSW